MILSQTISGFAIGWLSERFGIVCVGAVPFTAIGFWLLTAEFFTQFDLILDAKYGLTALVYGIACCAFVAAGIVGFTFLLYLSRGNGDRNRDVHN